jgi:hypothetical protein
MQENLHLNNLKYGLAMTEVNIKDIRWGGSGIEKVLFDFISDRFDHGSDIVEFGSGYCSTGAFSTIFNVFSVDDNSKFQHLYNNVKYITAPLKNGWYDIDILNKNLPKKYSFIFIDGPTGSGNRNGIIDNITILRDVPIIIHDTYRDPEIILSISLAKLLNKQVKFYSYGDFWAIIE